MWEPVVPTLRRLARRLPVPGHGDVDLGPVSNRFVCLRAAAAGQRTDVRPGGLALIRQYLVEGYHPTGYQVAGNGFTPSAALLKALVINGAVHLGGQRLISTDYRTEVEQEKAASCPGTSWKSVPWLHHGRAVSLSRPPA